GNVVRSDLADQFNELRDQLDKISDDASFNGINLLRGDKLKITFNETGTSSIDIQTKGEKAVDSTNLKLTTTLQAKDLDSDASIDTFLDQVKGALNTVRSQSSAFGSNLSIVQNRQDFTKSMINTLETGAGNLTLADMNQEAANMMALQTRQSLAQSTLSMANQADQGVLQLLR
ncbi:MAG: flagellin, partial [Devosia sp.]